MNTVYVPHKINFYRYSQQYLFRSLNSHEIGMSMNVYNNYKIVMELNIVTVTMPNQYVKSNPNCLKLNNKRIHFKKLVLNL
jgi:hypothetical protein